MRSFQISAFLCLASLLAWGGCASTQPDTKPASKATSNTAAQNKAIARRLIRSEYAQWDDARQFQCLDKLWQAESHWNHRARNKRTGACGIPQSYPCNKMSGWGKAYGVDYRTNPWPQIAWGLQYIDERYGDPCSAWKRFQRGGGY
ncbi:MAG: transglycosylase SLT domain-containing protein [Polyangiales bacterium]